MKIKYYKYKILQLIMLIMLVSGCATSPISMYPDFNKHKKNLGTIAIVADVVVMHDVDGDIDEVIVSESKQLSSDVLMETRDLLVSHGYQVGDIIVSSLGHGINRVREGDDYKYLVKPGADDESSADGMEPPFYVAHEFNTTENQQALAEIFSMLRHVQKTPESDSQIFKVPDGLLQDIKADKIMFIGSYSRQVDFSKQLGQALLTAFLTLGTVAVNQVSYTDGALAILDTKTGEIIWSDNTYFKGGTGTAGDVKTRINRMVKNIPPVDI